MCWHNESYICFYKVIIYYLMLLYFCRSCIIIIATIFPIISSLPEYHRREAEKLIRDNVKHVDAFIAVSQFHADSMASYLKIPDQKLHVVPLGIRMDDYKSKVFTRSEQFTIGYFARITPEKVGSCCDLVLEALL